MRNPAKFALCPPLLLALAACGDGREADTATDIQASAVPVDEPAIPLGTFGDARDDQAADTYPIADPAMESTPDVSEGDTALGEE